MISGLLFLWILIQLQAPIWCFLLLGLMLVVKFIFWIINLADKATSWKLPRG